ncbi:hypothetical protein BC835DRAFT_1378290 [Cytidiella melzeri]|nr:hypothetical protein BC835DRAFT_1378290 [Cytidiella melzeri]
MLLLTCSVAHLAFFSPLPLSSEPSIPTPERAQMSHTLFSFVMRFTIVALALLATAGPAVSLPVDSVSVDSSSVKPTSADSQPDESGALFGADYDRDTWSHGLTATSNFLSIAKLAAIPALMTWSGNTKRNDDIAVPIRPTAQPHSAEDDDDWHSAHSNLDKDDGEPKKDTPATPEEPEIQILRGLKLLPMVANGTLLLTMIASIVSTLLSKMYTAQLAAINAALNAAPGNHTANHTTRAFSLQRREPSIWDHLGNGAFMFFNLFSFGNSANSIASVAMQEHALKAAYPGGSKPNSTASIDTNSTSSSNSSSTNQRRGEPVQLVELLERREYDDALALLRTPYGSGDSSPPDGEPPDFAQLLDRQDIASDASGLLQITSGGGGSSSTPKARRDEPTESSAEPSSVDDLFHELLSREDQLRDRDFDDSVENTARSSNHEARSIDDLE